MALLLLLAATSAAAQGITGTVSGTITDTQGGVMPGATVFLISETQGTRTLPVVTNSSGAFVVPNVANDRYTIVVEMPSFKTLNRPGVAVSSGSQVAVGALVLEVGAVGETVTVTSEAPLLQTASGDRSAVVDASDVQNLPLTGRTTGAVMNLIPGVVGDATTLGERVGGGGIMSNNLAVDGMTAMEIGSNRLVTTVALESVQEVKVVVSSSAAEYGRGGGMQINSVTKSGTNQFRGSIYDFERNSKWNANSRTNILNGDQKTKLEERDYGFSLGGPIGKPGGNNKLFFYALLEVNPRTQGGNVTTYRLPTALERQGDFSQTLDNQGRLYNLIKDPLSTAPCTAANTAGCFQDGGVVGRIPANRLYQTGLNLLKWYPMPNIPNADIPVGQSFNYRAVEPDLTLRGWQPVIKFDYQATSNLRTSYKFLQYQQSHGVIPGLLPGWNDTDQHNPGTFINGVTANYVVTPTLFVEGTWGNTSHHQEGCVIRGGSPVFCRNASPVNASASRTAAGLSGLPYLFPDAVLLSPTEQQHQYKVLSEMKTPIFANNRLDAVPVPTWGSRIGTQPQTPRLPGNFIETLTQNATVAVTKVWGQHTVKSGFYWLDATSWRGTGSPVGTLNFAQNASNPLDTTFGYANAAIGVFNEYSQSSKLPEGEFVFRNYDGFIQDNWKARAGLTLDYGLRIAYAQPHHDASGKSSNFLPEQWQRGQAPVLYVAGCANGVYPCSGTNRQAMNPLNGTFLGPNSALAIGALVPNTGNRTNGLFLPGQGIVKTMAIWDVVYAPRFGVAWDVWNDQKVVVRGGGGLYSDRPDGDDAYGVADNPPNVRSVTANFGDLGLMAQGGQAGLSRELPPALFTYEYDRGPMQSWQWNGGVQMALPWSSAVDIAYTGMHAFNVQNQPAIQINDVDLGAAFLPQNDDPSIAGTGTARSNASLNPNALRFYQGYGRIGQRSLEGWQTSHQLVLSFNRRFRDGVSFGLSDTISLYDHRSTNPRIEHDANGWKYRADQELADEMLGTFIPNAIHILKANFVWALPQFRSEQSAMRALGHVVNGWQLAGVLSADTGEAYDVGFQYASGGANVEITGSPDFAPRIKLVGDAGSGCSSDPLKQFNTVAYQGPTVGSVGLDSKAGVLRRCGKALFDMAISRTIRLGGERSLQLRIDVFNALNTATVTTVNTTAQFASPATSTVVTNLPYDATGNVIPTFSTPRNAGFGVATGYTAPRTVQLQVRFGF